MTHTKTTDWSELKRLAEAAIEADKTHTGLYAPGVWHVVEYGDEQSPGICVHSGDAWRVCFMATIQSQKDYDQQMAKAQHIAAANPATVLELIAEVERQEGVIKIMANHNVELIDEIDALTAQRDEMAEALGECLEAMEIVQSGNYGTCPVVSDPACRNDGPETPCPRCGDLGWFSDDPEYDPEKDGNCINDGASAILRKPISRARSSLNKEKTDEIKEVSP